jgi:hypothetical protein
MSSATPRGGLFHPRRSRAHLASAAPFLGAIAGPLGDLAACLERGQAGSTATSLAGRPNLRPAPTSLAAYLLARRRERVLEENKNLCRSLATRCDSASTAAERNNGTSDVTVSALK